MRKRSVQWLEKTGATCRITRPSYAELVTYDSVTGVATREHTDELVYEGPCRIELIPGSQVQYPNDQAQTVSTTVMYVPWHVDNIQVLDQVEMLTEDDPTLVGPKLFTVVAQQRGGGLRTSRRFNVEVKHNTNG